MKAAIQHNNKIFQVDLLKPIDISIPLKASIDNPNAWYLDAPKIEPVVFNDWVGSVAKGASTNFNNIQFNPHAHGTHTECVGHITRDFYSLNEQLKSFFFIAQLISVLPKQKGEDKVITKEQLQAVITGTPEAIVIRTMPNLDDKLTKQYSHSNPPYIEAAGAVYLKELGVKHLLIDLPSVDKEEDGGALLSHNAFWNTQGELRLDATITEFIYVANEVEDGEYLLNLQIASFHNDASPSKPILYKIV